MILRFPFMLASVVVPLLLSACSTSDGYPSLARRSFETVVPASPAPSVPQQTLAPDANLSTRIESLRSQARAGASAFDAYYGEAASRVRAGASAPVGSENWAVAEVAIARLEQERSPAMVALAGLDSLYADRMNAVARGEADSAALDAIEAARQSILAAVESQNSRIAVLTTMLSMP